MTTRPLEGKPALVTGGSRGVGAGIADRLAADGATVAFTDARSAARADAVAAAAATAGGAAHPVRADSMHEEDVAAAVTQSVERFGGLDILVNNADRTPFPDQSIYALTEGALASLTRGLARELAPRGITINNIQPGPIDTDANPANGPVAPAMLGVMATERYGTAAEIGAFVCYRAGPDAHYITGSSLNIDGGFTA